MNTSMMDKKGIIETINSKSNSKFIISLMITLCVGVTIYAQRVNKKLGDNYYNHMAYIKAIKSYEKALIKDSSDIHILKHLAQSYKNSGDYFKAEEFYNLLFIENDTASMEAYAHLLVYNNDYNGADSIISKYHLKLDSYKRSFVDTLMNAEPEYIVNNANVNTAFADHRPCFFKDDLIFSSARDTSKKKYEWNGQPFLSLYMASVKSNGTLSNVRQFTAIDSRYHISSFQYVPNRRLAFFTINNASAFSTTKSANNEVNLGIYTSKYENGTWQKPMPLANVSDGNYSSAHPFYATHEDRLYFSSNRPGGLGGSDIYYVEVYMEGTSEPINCGESINTSGDEMYPFVSPDGQLYFSSDGHLSLGGLDIYCANIEDDIFDKAINLGVPVNSARDDFSLIFKEDEPFGYFASNRTGGLGDDDIYAVTRIKKETVEDESNEALASEYSLPASTGNTINSEDAAAIAIVTPVAALALGSEAVLTPVIAKQVVPISEEELTIESLSDILLESRREGTKIDNSQFEEMKLRLYNINFSFNSWDINSESAIELDKLADMMRKNTSLTIELSSHTDSRGNADYNMVLSQARADAVLKYLLRKGISIYRLKGKGYGEGKLLNHCIDGVSCSEELHKENRRVEALITSY